MIELAIGGVRLAAARHSHRGADIAQAVAGFVDHFVPAGLAL